jgi:hypothetical protein
VVFPVSRFGQRNGSRASSPSADCIFQDFLSGKEARFTLAILSSSASDMLSYISMEAPTSFDLGISPRFAERAAPAAFCWDLETAGMFVLHGFWVELNAPRVGGFQARVVFAELVAMLSITPSSNQPARGAYFL